MPLKQNSLRILIWQSQRLLEEDRPRLEPPQQQVQQLQLQQPEHLRKQKTLVMQQKRRRRQGRRHIPTDWQEQRLQRPWRAQGQGQGRRLGST